MFQKLIFCLSLSLTACSTSDIKERINKAGDAAGQAAGEFVEGAKKGVTKAFDVQVSYSNTLTDQGIEFGKATISNDSVGTDNLLMLYVIFNKDFEGKLRAKAFDDHSKEMGRASISLIGKKDQTQFIEFHFDKRTIIDSKSKLEVEAY